VLSDIAIVYCRLDVGSCKGAGRAEHNISEPETWMLAVPASRLLLVSSLD